MDFFDNIVQLFNNTKDGGSMFTNKREDQAQSPLLSDDNMPKNVRVIELYSQWLSSKDLCLFAQTSQKAELETVFLRLLDAAISAEPESYKQPDETKLAAMAILKRHPELLFQKRTVIDHFGRKIKASPYRLFLGAGDTWALKQIHEEIIPNIKNGAAIAEAQFKAQFPHCPLPFDPKTMGEEVFYDERNKEQIKQIEAQLKIIVAKITADPCTNGEATMQATKDAIEELRQIFAPKKNEIIKTGLHFPLGIMQAIYKVYDAQFNPWSGAQLSLFSREVIGPAEAASTAVDGQCYKTGLSNMDMNKGPDRRDGLFCRHPKGIPPELAPINDKLGQTMFVDPYDAKSCFKSSNVGRFDWYNKNGPRRDRGAGPLRPSGVLLAGSDFGGLWLAKISDLQNLYSQPANRYRFA